MIIIAAFAGFALVQEGRPKSYEEWKARETARIALREKVNQADRESTAWFRKAEIDMGKGKLDEAERKCFVGLRLYPEYAKGSITADGYCVLGKIEMKRSNFAKAIDDFQYSLKGGIPKVGVFTMSGPVDLEVRSNLARSFLKVNEKDMALKTVLNLATVYQSYFNSIITLDEIPSRTDPRAVSVEATIRLIYASLPASPGQPYHKIEDMIYVQERYPSIYGLDLMLAEIFRSKKNYSRARHYIRLADKAKGYVKSQLDIVAQGIDMDEAQDMRSNPKT